MATSAKDSPWADTLGLAVLRWLPLALLSAHVVGVGDLDQWVAAACEAVWSTTFFRQPMAEAYVAAFSFLGWIILFSLADALPWLARFRLSKFTRDAKPAHIVLAHGVLIWATFLAIGEPFGRAVPLVICLAHMAIACMAGTASAIRRHDGMLFYTVRAYFQFMGYLAGIKIFHLFKVPAASPAGGVTALRLVGEVAFGVAAYDFLFSWLHYGMHRAGPRAIDHHQHHEIAKFSGRLLASDTVNHGPLDFALQVAVNIVVQNIGLFGAPKHKLSRFLHNVVVTGLLVESHAGYDAFWSSHRLYPGVFGGALRHLEHHTKGKRFYQQFFCYLDDMVFR
mmetsp:Transcript_118123/g.368000  ORF Transcript_118123/g.368000 Transcript_118123/m.368000 type:complete len:337 (+) Transcript_118123:20-1030(+)